MGTGSSRNYDVGPKNNWRRAIWNEILRRTAGREKEEMILYLAGPQDLDRIVAVQKRVPDRNLIAIDVVTDNVQRVRTANRPAVQGDIVDVLWSWPEDRPVCAVLLDFCSGIEWGTGGVYDALQSKALRGAVAMVNFMRGRDPFSNDARENLERAGLLKPLWRLIDGEETPTLVVEETTNRAYQFIITHAWDLFTVAVDGWNVETANSSTMLRGGKLRLVYPEADDAEGQRFFHAMIGRIVGVMRPRFFSYRSSGNLTFDSVVFETHVRKLDQLPESMKSVGEMAELEISELKARNRDPALARRIAAMLAVRTRRLKKRGR